MLLKSRFYVTQPTRLKHVIGMFQGIRGVIKTCHCHVSKDMEWICFGELKHLLWHLLKT
jgi:hypothetical protein